MADETEIQKFNAVHVVVASSGTAQPGEQIALTREEYEVARGCGSIVGEWKEKAAAKKPSTAE